MTRHSAEPTVVRVARRSDAAGVSALAQVAFPRLHEDLLPPDVVTTIVAATLSPAAIRSYIDRSSGQPEWHFLVAESDGLLGGYLHHDGAEGEPELHRLYVDPQRKRGGIGSALMHALHGLLRPGKSYILFVHAANADAISFYEHHGLVQEAQVEMTYPGVDLAEDTRPSLVLRMRYTKP